MTAQDEVDVIAVPEGWDSVTLGDLADGDRGISYGIVQPGQHVIDGVPIVRVQNIVDGVLDTSDVMRVAPEIAAKYRRTSLRGGELLLSLVGSVGSSAIAPPEAVGWNTARAVAVVPLRDGIDARFVRFALRSAPLQHLMEVWCNTTVQATLNLKDVSRLPIPIPPQHEREAIVEVLAALDDKLELNKRMNQTLKEIAASLFRSWFVDFDPVVAKAAGRTPFALNSQLANLFPARFQDSELGPIPFGWEVVPVGNVMQLHDSKRIPISGAERAKRPGKYPYYGAASVVDFIDDYIFEGVFLLLGEDGSVVDADGYPVTQYVWGKIWVNNHAHVITGSEGVSTEMLLLFFQETMLSPYVTGAVQPKLNQQNLKGVPFIRPTRDISEQFERIVAPWFAQLRQNEEESRTLTALRDTLLPELLSGELRVRDSKLGELV